MGIYDELLQTGKDVLDQYAAQHGAAGSDNITQSGIDRLIGETADSLVPGHNKELALIFSENLAMGNIDHDCDGSGQHSVFGMMRWITYNQICEDLAEHAQEHHDEWFYGPVDDPGGDKHPEWDDVSHPEKFTWAFWRTTPTAAMAWCVLHSPERAAVTVTQDDLIIFIRQFGMTFAPIADAWRVAVVVGGTVTTWSFAREQKDQGLADMKAFLRDQQDIDPDGNIWQSVIVENDMPHALRQWGGQE